ncbi:tRNA pseudouridine(55) synthase TruB [Pseudactinotalea sp. HY160]|uniref:tRNA pseudouridine(55) synthase TruB n=1 Tax=Pseudactinotalea sp. HY160 TaxID=2654490 RepID=UPI00128DDFCB|nr:tRNA pseudouridine(55) synthase TruB [Pseudactinotalea sp. HY160]MPV49580.1 tRNA pseudouridine(55) synthase TruB [Pseudactinotalea sp. HY160]
MNAPDGLLLLDKPAGLTSHGAVARTRRALGTRKVGHAGTLDPMATGLLVLGIGRATRLLTYIVGVDKTYTATIRLGQGTNTDDAEGEATSSPGARLAAGPERVVRLEPDGIEAVAAGLRGPIEQVPSAVSAIKVDGKRAYARVRAGEEVALPARPVTIHRFALAEPRASVAADGTPVVDVDAVIDCSSGTYVRALARDLGARLGCGGHLTALRRTRVGPFDLDPEPTATAARTAAVRADDTLPRTAPDALLSVTTALRLLLPARELTEGEARAVRYGQSLAAGGMAELAGAFDPAGRGIAVLSLDGERARPVLVLDPA